MYAVFAQARAEQRKKHLQQLILEGQLLLLLFLLMFLDLLIIVFLKRLIPLWATCRRLKVQYTCSFKTEQTKNLI